MPINSFIYPAPSTPGGYEVANSVRYNDGDNPSMHKTPGSAGNRRTWTFSAWVKRTTVGAAQRIFSQGNHSSGDPMTYLKFNSDDTIQFDRYVSATEKIQTNRKFRDVSAWYHIVLRCDTTNGTAGDRFRLYINGTEETSFSTDNNPSQNADTEVNNTQKFELGSVGASTENFDGYFAEVCLVDGSSLAPTSFGEFDEDSPKIWKPIDVSGLTFGTNGFYLDFEDSANLGNDTTGGTDLTEVTLAATDAATDSPTNNFAIGNSLLKRGSSTVSEGNLKIQDSAGAWQGLSTTIGASAGKWYCEWKVTAVNSNSFGVQGEATYSISNDGTAIGFKTPSVSILQNGDRYIDNSGASYSGTFTTNDIIGCAMDLDDHKVYFSKGGEWSDGSGSWDSTTFNSSVGAISLSQTSGFYFFGHSVHTATSEANYGNPPYSISSGNADANGYGNFEYAPPSGYYSLCTKNLAEFGG